MQECDLIIIDDVFYVEPTRAELQVFYRAVTFLNETRSIIFITNREISAWIDAARGQAPLPDFIGQGNGQLSNCSFD
jgi:DNA replication protein DnaC